MYLPNQPLIILEHSTDSLQFAVRYIRSVSKLLVQSGWIRYNWFHLLLNLVPVLLAFLLDFVALSLMVNLVHVVFPFLSNGAHFPCSVHRKWHQTFLLIMIFWVEPSQGFILGSFDFPFNESYCRGSVDSSKTVCSMSDLSAVLRIEVMVFSDLRRLSYSSDLERPCSAEFCGAMLSRDMMRSAWLL